MALSSLPMPCWPGARVQVLCLALHRAGKAERLYREFNGRIRDELLNETLFFDLDNTRAKIASWVADYNPVSYRAAPRARSSSSINRGSLV